ncbi:MULTISPECIES: BofC C-terminal domain-containing protein [Paenibacillus]|uniref:Bypass of forespore C C-terminal domain-containing protein n=1 Tax=Paenibacillus apis TaxID=1792174 RepID=A0A920CPC1_9BACL|nr:MULTISPECIES: BofC C-terminal domain-containing protein [Paenibacillus]GIO44724.1 hypothetical protein J41TS4_44820 [Paenibacillus apis]
MNIFHTKKQLRRRWRRWRRAVWTFGAFVLITLMAWSGMLLSEEMKTLMTEEPISMETWGQLQELRDDEESSLAWLEQLRDTDQVRIVHLNKIYTCGEENVVLGLMRPWEITELAKSHAEWKGRLAPGGDVWFDEHVEGLSELCGREGYIGIDSNGNLSLFDGPPKKEKVIRTFFQLDVETMESALPSEVLNQLQAGIRIQDVEEYNSVLSTFSDYAMPESEQMLQQKQ